MSLIDEAKKKLHSEKGSSLLIALLLFFVCLILSMSILSAAVASRVRIKGEKERNQEILNLESAIGVLTEGLGTIEYYRREKKLESGDWDVEESRMNKISGVFDGGKLEEKLKFLLDAQGGAVNGEDERFSIYLEGYEKNVYIHPQVENGYFLVFYVELKKEDHSYDKVYKISYTPTFNNYFGDLSFGATYDEQEKCYLSSDKKELCVTWKQTDYVLQRVVD